MINAKDWEGYEDLARKILDSYSVQERLAGLAPEDRLAGLAPEDRLAGLAPEERLAGLAPGEWVLALPDEGLRALAASFIDTLPERVRARVLTRLGN